MSGENHRGGLKSPLRRGLLVAGAGSALGGATTTRAAGANRAAAVSLRAPGPVVRLHEYRDGGASTLLAVSANGELWSLSSSAWRRIGSGLDPTVPLASGSGRIAARTQAGGLWTWERERVATAGTVTLAPHAGLLVLAFAVIGIAAGSGDHGRVIRLEPDGDGWRETARFAGAVLPDARPVRFDPDGSNSDEDGHVAVHGVLGDALEATALHLLERHSLEPMARLELPPPHVFEDLAPRPIAWGKGRGLLTVRSGPQGAQLAVVARSDREPRRLVLAALGEPLGRPQRWLSPTTNGEDLAAVHTPHIGGVLYRYRRDGERLRAELLERGVSNHTLGQRDLDVSAWLGRRFVVPAQDHRSLRIIDLRGEAGAAAAHGTEREVELSAPAVALQRWSRDGVPGVAVALQDGSLVWLAMGN